MRKVGALFRPINPLSTCLFNARDRFTIMLIDSVIVLHVEKGLVICKRKTFSRGYVLDFSLILLALIFKSLVDRYMKMWNFKNERSSN